MRREDVIRMAGEAGFNLHHNPELYDCMVANYKSIERFAALVAEAEREACAEVCLGLEAQLEEFDALNRAAAAIRARGQL
jgi:hypothetical protein